MQRDQLIRLRLTAARRLLVLELDHWARVRAEQLDDSDAEKAVRLRRATIERMARLLERSAPQPSVHVG